MTNKIQKGPAADKQNIKKAGFVVVDAYETTRDDFSVIVAFYTCQTATKQNRIGAAKLDGFETAQQAFAAGYKLMNDTVDDLGECYGVGHYNSNRFKKNYFRAA